MPKLNRPILYILGFAIVSILIIVVIHNFVLPPPSTPVDPKDRSGLTGSGNSDSASTPTNPDISDNQTPDFPDDDGKWSMKWIRENASEKGLEIATDPRSEVDGAVYALTCLPPTMISKDKQILKEKIIYNRDRAEEVRHEAMEILLEQRKKDPVLGTDLVKMYSDPQEKGAWRDFCIQYMHRAYPYAENKEEIEVLLFKIASETKPETGTALISLQKISEEHPKIKTKLANLAMATVNKADDDDFRAKENAITALQVAAKAGDPEALKKARILAVKQGEKTRLRMSAIATLGRFGDKSDLKIVEPLQKDKSDRLRYAAKKAVERINKRFP